MEENADTVTIANAGVGAASQLCGLLFEQAIDVDLTEVPYDGTGPALTDLVGGQVDFMCDQTTNTAATIQSGDIKAYAVTTPERIDVLPDLPTTAEAGLPELELGVWHGFYVPADTPDEIVAKLTDALQVALEDQGVIDQMAKLGTTPVPLGPGDAGGAHGQAGGADRPVGPDHRGSRGHGRMSTNVGAPGDTAGSLGEGSSGPSRPDLLAGATFVVLGLAFAIGGSQVRRRLPRCGWARGTSRWGSAACLTVLGLVIVVASFRGVDPTVANADRGPVPWRRMGLLLACGHVLRVRRARPRARARACS